MNSTLLRGDLARGIWRKTWALAVFFSAVGLCGAVSVKAASDRVGVVREAQLKVAKIYGAGGFRGLEAYQSGVVISPEGYILTVWSYVLDTENISVSLADGSKYEAKLLGADPTLEIAILKVDAHDLPYFSLDDAPAPKVGARVLAFSNLFGVAVGDEPVSVQMGVVAAIGALSARRGAFESRYRGPVYMVDAVTNNPGAAGGALTDRSGRFIGLLGKELRNAKNNTWLNYALPAAELTASVDAIKRGETRPRAADGSARRPLDPHQLANLGITTVPNVLNNTPPFVDRVDRNSPAFAAGLRADDLILFVDGRLVSSIAALQTELELISRDQPLRLTVQRGGELINVVLKSSNRR